MNLIDKIPFNHFKPIVYRNEELWKSYEQLNGFLSKNFESVLNARIKRLEQLRDTLSSRIDCRCLSLKSCALYNHSDHAGQHGTGAMFLLEASESDAT